MPTKHAILSELTANELRAAVTGHGLSVPDMRVKDQLVGALERKRKVQIGEVIASLRRQRLKDLCRALDLDDSGVRKADLVARLTRVEQPAKKRTGTAPQTSRGSVERAAPSSRKVLTVDELEKHLWAAADILRGSIDSSDYKSYIFGLLFLKRLSDRFEEEAEKLIAEGEPEKAAWEDPINHQFFVPDRARWHTILKTSTDIDRCLNEACHALEKANPELLEGVLVDIDYNNERRLGDSRQRNNVLASLVQHFSQISLRNDRMAEPDLLGRAYEYLIERFADDAGKKGGEFYTPSMVVKLIVKLLAPEEGMRICDPTVGSGGMLIECAHYVEDRRGNRRNLTLHGQEKNRTTWAICKMNMLLHGLPDARIETDDTIRTPKLVEDGKLRRYDRVIANPPFSLTNWGKEEAAHDSYGRFRFGLPPKTKGDLAFVQHMVATLNTQGRCGVVMPHGVLYRPGSEAQIRQGMLQEDLFEAVIGLAPRLFYGATISTAILVLSRGKPRKRQRKVLFIDASGVFEEGGSQNRLRAKDVDQIVKTFCDYKDVARFARIVSLDEIEQNGWNLNINLYISAHEEDESVDVVEAARRLERERTVAESTMNDRLAELQKLLLRASRRVGQRRKRTPIGNLPDDWKVVPLVEACEAPGQYGANSAKADFRPGGVRYVRITDIKDDGSLKEEAVGIGTRESEKYLLRVGDMLFARSGSVGKSYLHREQRVRCAFAGYLVRFRTDQKVLLPSFLKEYVNTTAFWRWIAKHRHGGGQSNINATEYGELPVPCPPLDDQRAVVQIAEALDEAMEAAKEQVSKLEKTKRSLMSGLLTGALRITSDSEVK